MRVKWPGLLLAFPILSGCIGTDVPEDMTYSSAEIPRNAALNGRTAHSALNAAHAFHSRGDLLPPFPLPPVPFVEEVAAGPDESDFPGS